MGATQSEFLAEFKQAFNQKAGQDINGSACQTSLLPSSGWILLLGSVPPQRFDSSFHQPCLRKFS